MSTTTLQKQKADRQPRLKRSPVCKTTRKFLNYYIPLCSIFMNTLPSPSRSICVQSLHLSTIIIDQTTLKDDLSLIICQLTQSYIELLQSVTFNSISLDHVCFFLNRLADSREEQIITVLERKISGRGSGMEAYPS